MLQHRALSTTSLDLGPAPKEGAHVLAEGDRVEVRAVEVMVVACERQVVTSHEAGAGHVQPIRPSRHPDFRQRLSFHHVLVRLDDPGHTIRARHFGRSQVVGVGRDRVGRNIRFILGQNTSLQGEGPDDQGAHLGVTESSGLVRVSVHEKGPRVMQGSSKRDPKGQERIGIRISRQPQGMDVVAGPVTRPMPRLEVVGPHLTEKWSENSGEDLMCPHQRLTSIPVRVADLHHELRTEARANGLHVLEQGSLLLGVLNGRQEGR